jgi:hypothetical protein
MNIYVANGWQALVLILGALAVVFLVAAGVCALFNLVAGRRVLRPWLWGGLVAISWLAFVVAYHFVTLYRLKAAP